VTSKRFQFHPEAERELTEAAEWYEERKSGLGADLVTSVRMKIEEILVAPERWPSVRGVRRALLSRFPYAIVYRDLRGEVVEIIAVAHLRRRPKYWSAR
jgi:plasmid stabilization system protein ParE